MSAQFKPMEQVFIQIGKGEKDDPVYKLNTAEQDCLDSFMFARNGALLYGKTNMSKEGRPINQLVTLIEMGILIEILKLN